MAKLTFISNLNSIGPKLSLSPIRLAIAQDRIESVILSTLLLSTALTSCSTTSVNIQSFPDGADVYIKPIGKGEAKLLGKTPYLGSGSNLEKENGGAGPVLIELKKDGYQPLRTLITETQSVDLSLNLTLTSVSGLEDHEKLNSLLDRLFDSQHLARRGSYDQALSQIKSVQKEAPQLAASYEIEGGILYLQKKYKDSLSSYIQAVKYNPKNIEAIKMRSLLEGALKIKPDQTVTPPNLNNVNNSPEQTPGGTSTNPGAKP